jgi:hypothetical protein
VGEGGIEAALHDHRRGTEMRHHLSDRPLTGIRRLSDGGIVEGLDDAAKPSNRVGERVEMGRVPVGHGAPSIECGPDEHHNRELSGEYSPFVATFVEA